MANGWVSGADNADMVADMALTARKCVALAAGLLEIRKPDRTEADRDRERFRDTHGAGTDAVALAVSCSSVLADRCSGFSKERVPAEARWLASVAFQALSALRVSLSDTEVAGEFGTDAAACRSGTSAAALELPGSFRETVAALDAWTGDLLSQVGRDPVPGAMTLAEAVAASGGAPCAVVLDGEAGSPVIVTGILQDGTACGFPTIGFLPSDRWARRGDWLAKLVVRDNGERRWSAGQSRPGVVADAVARLNGVVLPTLRKLRPTLLYSGTSVIAAGLGVTTPRLAAWMRQQGHVVRGGDGWVPNLAYGRETVFKKVRDKRVSYLWSPEFVDALRPKAAEIADTAIVRGTPAPPRPPSEKQIAFMMKLAGEAGVEVPDGAMRSAKAASDLIGLLAAQPRDRIPTDKQVGFLRKLAERTGTEIPEGTFGSAELVGAMIGELAGQHAAGRARRGPGR